MTERILYHICIANISYGVSRISYRVSDISLKSATNRGIMPVDEGAIMSVQLAGTGTSVGANSQVIHRPLPDHKGELEMNKIDKTGRILNWVLGIVYVPISFFSWLLPMASDGTIDATNPIYISLVNIFCAIAFIIPFLCIAGIVISMVLRTRGRNILSIIIQFLPLVIFILNLILLYFTESLPRML